MFYYLLSGLMSYNVILIVAAVLPALFLMAKVYRADRLEREPAELLWRLMLAGVLAALLALVLERIFGGLIKLLFSRDARLYQVVLYFGVVAFSEEGAKYLLLTKRTWRSPEFNCQYDGVVYAVFVSLGFALWENISYVLHYGFGTALVRAVTAIPGHACFGVFMGVFYALAKRQQRRGALRATRLLRVLALLVPAFLHGAYDYIATVGGSTLYFIVFVAALFAVSYVLVGKMARKDRYV